MAPRGLECWFGVGKPDGNHSMVWKVWGGRNAPDLYVTARSLGGAMKASIHASGQRRVGLTSEYVRSTAHSGGTRSFGLLYVHHQSWSGGTRHYDSWEGGHHLGTVASLEFLLRFPTAELRPFPLTQSDLDKNVFWLTPAPAGQTIEVALLYLPPEAQPPAVPAGSGTQIVSAGTLTDGRQVFLAGIARPNRVFSNQAQMLREVAERMWAAGIRPSELSDRFRLIAGFDLEGIRGFTEMAASSLGNPEGTISEPHDRSDPTEH